MLNVKFDPKSEYTININVSIIATIAILWSYGYQGAINTKNLAFQVIFSVILSLVIIYLIYNNDKNLFRVKIKLSAFDIVIFLSLSAIWTLITYEKLKVPITGDQFYYAISSKRHQIVMIMKYLPSFFDEYQFKNILYLFDWMIITMIITGIYVLKRIKIKKLKLAIFCVSIFLILRLVTILAGGGGSPFGPLQLMPLWLSSAIFGTNDVAFRLPQIGVIIIINFYIYTKLKGKRGKYALIMSISACSIPLLVHVATMSEASIWATLAWTIAILAILSDKHYDQSKWFSVIVMISALALCRITSIIPLFILLLSVILLHRKEIFLKKDYVSLLLIPCSISLPFFFFNIINGTPAIYSSEEFVNIPNSHSTISRIQFAINEGIVLLTATSTVGFIFLMPIAGLVLKRVEEKNYFIKRLVIIIMFVLGIAMFFSIRPVLWTTDRYKVEYLVPFAIAGIYLIYDVIPRNFEKIISVAAIFLILAGIYGFKTYHQPNQFLIQTNQMERETEIPYDFESPLKNAKEEGLSENVMISGSTSGVLPQIITGYTVNEVRIAQSFLKLPLQSKTDWTSLDPELVNKINGLQMIVITDSQDEGLHKKFENLGWIKSNSYDLKNYGTTITMKRKETLK